MTKLHRGCYYYVCVIEYTKSVLDQHVLLGYTKANGENGIIMEIKTQKCNKCNNLVICEINDIRKSRNLSVKNVNIKLDCTKPIMKREKCC